MLHYGDPFYFYVWARGRSKRMWNITGEESFTSTICSHNRCSVLLCNSLSKRKGVESATEDYTDVWLDPWGSSFEVRSWGTLCTDCERWQRVWSHHPDFSLHLDTLSFFAHLKRLFICTFMHWINYNCIVLSTLGMIQFYCDIAYFAL